MKKVLGVITLSLFALTAFGANNDMVLGGYDPGSTVQSQTSELSQSLAQSASPNLFHDPRDPVAGNPNGSLTLVEFFDYRCSHCQAMNSVIIDIIRKNPNLRVVFKEFPIGGAISEYASQAALAALKQGKYVAFHDAVLALGVNVTNETVLETAKKLGLDMTQLKKDMASESVTHIISANQSLGAELHISGTPSFFLNRDDSRRVLMVAGEVTQNYMQDTINQMKFVS